MADAVSTFRLYLMRCLYLLNFLGLGWSVWPALVNPEKMLEPLPGVAFSFWAALSLLMGLGVRYPLKMLPLLLLQLVYKCIWLAAIAVPLWAAGRYPGMTKIFLIGVVADLLVIPWPYVVAHYVKERGDRWKSMPAPAAARTG